MGPKSTSGVLFGVPLKDGHFLNELSKLSFSRSAPPNWVWRKIWSSLSTIIYIRPYVVIVGSDMNWRHSCVEAKRDALMSTTVLCNIMYFIKSVHIQEINHFRTQLQMWTRRMREYFKICLNWHVGETFALKAMTTRLATWLAHT
jgi:hypothetical protein